MPQCKTRNGKTVITLYEREKKTLRDAENILGFVGRVLDSAAPLSVSASCAAGNISDVMTTLRAETPEDDTPKDTAKPDRQLAKA